jgi:hypothetical protein
MSSKKKPLRIDMVITEVQVIDEEKGIIAFTSVPDPRVWEKTVIDGEKGYLHKLDGLFLSDKELAKAVPSLRGKPIYAEKIGIEDKEKYLRRSKTRIEKKRDKKH